MQAQPRSRHADSPPTRPLAAGADAARRPLRAARRATGELHTRRLLSRPALPDLRIGHDLSLASAREWGLYISTGRGVTSIGVEEPALFAEPGVFITRPDGTIFYGAVQTMPFARPHFDELLAAIDFALAKNHPARVEYVGV
ncbi:MAG: hypothetical protein ABI633_08115 [Burkholderiales bacterium]